MSINEIAALANVSKGTVSRVINNKGYVSEETRRKVEDVIKQHNYVPNQLARNLSNGKSKTVAIMCPYPGYECVTRGILSAASMDDHAAVFFETQFNPEKERHILNLLKEHYFDALIILRCSLPYSEIEQYQSNNNIVTCQMNDSDQISTLALDFSSLRENIVAFVKQRQQSFGIVLSRDAIMADEIQSTMRATYDDLYMEKNHTYQVQPAMSGGIAFAEEVIANNQTDRLPDIMWFDDVNTAAGFKQTFQFENRKSPEIIVLGVSPLAQFAQFITLSCHEYKYGQSVYNLLNKPIHKELLCSNVTLPSKLNPELA